MTNFQKYAVFQLVVTVSAALAYLILLVTTNVQAATAGFALLGVLGLGRVYFQHRKLQVEQDERDFYIRRKAGTIAFVVFWLCFVAWGVTVSLTYAAAATVPIAVVTPVVWIGAWLVYFVRSIAILALNARGA